MTTETTLTLIEFLLARIAEDEASLPEGFDCWYKPERYAAECEAKRRIVEDAGSSAGEHRALAWVFRALALPYADHPDYCEEWKP